MKELLNFIENKKYNKDQEILVVALAEMKEWAKQLPVEKRGFNFFAVMYLQKCIASHLVVGESLTLKAGELMFIKPGMPIAYSEIQDAEGWLMVFNREFFQSTLQHEFLNRQADLLLNLTEQFHFQISESDQFKLETLLKLMKQETLNKLRPKNRSLVMHYFSAFMHILSRYRRDKLTLAPAMLDKQIKLASLFKRMVKEHIKEHTKTSYYTEVLGVAHTTLQLATKHAFQKSPKQIIQEVMITEAQRMLANPSLRVHEIANKLGFSESTNFSKFFKKHTGTTPEKFREPYTIDQKK